MSTFSGVTTQLRTTLRQCERETALLHRQLKVIEHQEEAAIKKQMSEMEQALVNLVAKRTSMKIPAPLPTPPSDRPFLTAPTPTPPNPPSRSAPAPTPPPSVLSPVIP